MRFEDLGEKIEVVECPLVIGKRVGIKFAKTCELVFTQLLWVDLEFGSEIDSIEPVLISVALSTLCAVRIGKEVLPIKSVAEGHSLIE